MDGEEIILIFKRLIDDSPSDELCLDLLNIVRCLVEGDRPWRMLLKEDTSQTFGASDTYLTAKDLPDDFLYDVKLKLGIEVNDNYIEYDPCEFEERRQFSSSQRYCLDLANDHFYICGSVGQTYTVYLYYIYETPEITLTTSPVWPTKFQRIIPLLMAEIWKGSVDADILNLQQALALSKPAMLLMISMRNWDAVLKAKSMNNMTPIHSSKTGRQTSGLVPDNDNLL